MCGLEISVAMNVIVCELEQSPGVFCSSCTLVIAGGSLVIGIRGRLIPQRYCTWKYVEVVGGSLVMWDAFLHPAIWKTVVVPEPSAVCSTE